VVNARPPSSDAAELFLPRGRHDPERVRTWLTTLATLLAHDDPARPPERDITWWGLAHRSRVLTTWFGAGLVAVSTVATGIAGLVFFDQHWLRIACLVVGAGTGCGLWLVVREWGLHDPGYADFRVRGHVREFFTEIVDILRRATIAVSARPELIRGLTAVFVIGTVPVVVISPPSAPPPAPVPPTSPPAASSLGAPSVSYTVDSPAVTQAVTQAHPTGPSTDLLWDVFSSVAIVIALVLGGALLVVTTLVVIRVSERNAIDATSPRRSWRADRALTAVRCLTLGLATAMGNGKRDWHRHWNADRPGDGPATRWQGSCAVGQPCAA